MTKYYEETPYGRRQINKEREATEWPHTRGMLTGMDREEWKSCLTDN